MLVCMRTQAHASVRAYVHVCVCMCMGVCVCLCLRVCNSMIDIKDRILPLLYNFNLCCTDVIAPSTDNLEENNTMH